MTSYRRNFVPGATYFFTVNLLDRRSNLLTENVSLLRSAFQQTRASHPFDIDAIVILPDHMHAVWTLPEGDRDFANRWRLIKATFSRAMPVGEPLSASRAAKAERGIWQRRYWEHTVRDERDLERHINYIHFNPVKHGHVSQVRDWRIRRSTRWSARGSFRKTGVERLARWMTPDSENDALTVGWVERPGCWSWLLKQPRETHHLSVGRLALR